MKTILTYLFAFILYVLFSRAVSIPAALALHLRAGIVFFAIFGLDIIQIPLFFHIYERGFTRIPGLSLVMKRLPTKEQFEKSRIRKLTQSLGGFGVLFLAMTPTFGGGIWTAVLLAHILKLSRKQSYFFLITGSFISCLILTWGISVIFVLLHIIPRIY